MVQRKVTMKKIREILRLKEECGLSLRRISQAMKISRPVISEYLEKCTQRGINFRSVKDLPDDELEKLLKDDSLPRNEDDRHIILEKTFPFMSRELKRVGVTRHILWEEYLKDNPEGYGYSQFCHHYQVWEASKELSMHQVHKAGDKLFVDFAGEKLSIINSITGESTPVHIFVAVLGASQLTYVEAVSSQKKREFIEANVNALHYLGGVPAAIVPDNLKSAVTKAHRYEPDINPEYIDFARHYGITILPARPYKPRDKSLVEGAVKIVYQQIYAPLRNRVFNSIDALNAAIREELERYNARTMKGYGKSRRELFEEVEKAVLCPLPDERFSIRDFSRAKAGFNYHIYLNADKHYYSIPYQNRGRDVDVFCGPRTVEIHYKNERIALHVRNRMPYRYTTTPEHMPPNHRFKDDWSAEKFLTWGSSIGEDVRRVIEAVLSTRQHPEQGYKTCLAILSLAKGYSNERLRLACRTAVYIGAYTFRTIENILKNNMDGCEVQPELFDSPLPLHENIRGSEYYTTEEI